MVIFGKKQNTSAQAAKSETKSTQSFLDVADIKDGIVILKDGGLRTILAVSSVNFALKSEEEQNAVIGSYQNFLNSLDFPIQILMQSRRMDVGPYLDLMRDRMNSITNHLLQMQMAEYIEFITQLVETAHIMSKNFYVIVPYNVHPVKEGIVSRVSKIFNPAQSVILDIKSFEEHKRVMVDRTNQVISGLGAMGLQTIQLTTEEIIELLYSSYNIGAASALHADSLNKLDISLSEDLNQQ